MDDDEAEGACSPDLSQASAEQRSCRDCVPLAGLYVWTTEGRLPSVPGGGWAAPVVAPSGDGRTRGQISQDRLDGFGAGVALLSAARFYS